MLSEISIFVTMSEKYKTTEDGLYFVSSSVVGFMDAISKNSQESRKEWMQAQFKYYGTNSPQKQINQFWKHNNHPFYLYSNEMIQQKVNYIHNNSVEAGFVNEPDAWRLSSANEQSPIKVLKF